MSNRVAAVQWADFEKKRAQETGRKVGLKEGREEGMHQGLQQGMNQQLSILIKQILLKHPQWSNQEIAELLNTPVELVSEIRNNPRL